VNILFISSFIPKKNAPQAGVNFSYNIIKILKANTKNSVDLMCTFNSDEIDEDVTDAKEITDTQFLFEISKKRKLLNVLRSPLLPSIASVRYDNRMLKKLRDLAKIKTYDYVILDYTQNLNYYKCIKKSFKSAKIISLEQDVSFLGFERKSANSTGIKKIFSEFEYKRLKRFEINSLRAMDKIYTVNEKDKDLLSNLDNVEALYPFINEWQVEPVKHDDFNIMYWGAMNRKENEDAVIHFIKDIWDKVNKDNTKLYIIGSKPSDVIRNLECDNIIVTGFVENPTAYFSTMDLSIVPLRLGAGVKIKVLESMANGIPVITTSVGSEGIYAENYKEIIITDDANNFADSINAIKNDNKLREQIRVNAKDFIRKNYGFEKNRIIIEKYIL
jgi:glycosyltransferase involved in cell wall biosynthesis